MAAPQPPAKGTKSRDLPPTPQTPGPAINGSRQGALQFQLLFTAGDDRLRGHHYHQLIALASLLGNHTHLEVQLEGYADPRGSDGYNNVLSDQRALSVQHTLETLGVASVRIHRLALGASRSQAAKGDIDAYALERRVDIYLKQVPLDPQRLTNTQRRG